MKLDIGCCILAESWLMKERVQRLSDLEVCLGERKTWTELSGEEMLLVWNICWGMFLRATAEEKERMLR